MKDWTVEIQSRQASSKSKCGLAGPLYEWNRMALQSRPLPHSTRAALPCRRNTFTLVCTKSRFDHSGVATLEEVSGVTRRWRRIIKIFVCSLHVWNDGAHFSVHLCNFCDADLRAKDVGTSTRRSLTRHQLTTQGLFASSVSDMHSHRSILATLLEKSVHPYPDIEEIAARQRMWHRHDDEGRWRNKDSSTVSASSWRIELQGYEKNRSLQMWALSIKEEIIKNYLYEVTTEQAFWWESMERKWTSWDSKHPKYLKQARNMVEELSIECRKEEVTSAGLPQPPLILFFLSLFLSFFFSLADLILSFMSKSTNYGRN